MNSSPEPTKFVLTLNAGSSSLKFALFRLAPDLVCAASGTIDGIGQAVASLSLKIISTGVTIRQPLNAARPADCLAAILPAIHSIATVENIAAAGHRVVHGGPRYTAPQTVTSELIRELRLLSPLDPEHLPAEIELIEALQTRCPTLPQIACFDTAFHHELPRVAQLLPIPRRYNQAGVRRYGFHGLSYQFLLDELRRLGDPAATTGRVILAHLGNGASMAAVRNGKSIDTTMSFTPAAGLVMSSRTGDLDPGLVEYLARTEKMTAAEFQHLVNHESGLLGVSEISGDMRILLTQEPQDVRAAEAVALFCYQAKKWLGAFVAALGGVDTIVFAGGIGENCPSIRRRICEGLDFLGLVVDETSNAQNGALISAKNSRVAIRVIRTDEELMIARSVYAFQKTAGPRD
jgi:acetate kinase